jgi:hypothetical protein
MEFTPLKGKRALTPPGTLSVKLEPERWQPYRRLYQRYQSYLSGLPMLAERDFDGKRAVKLTPKQLEALNSAFARLSAEEDAEPRSAFEGQERDKSKLFKRLQYLS